MKGYGVFEEYQCEVLTVEVYIARPQEEMPRDVSESEGEQCSARLGLCILES